MAAVSAAARSYSKALFALAKERGRTETVDRELETVATTVAGDAELRTVLMRPWISADAKRKVAVEVANRLGVSPLVRDFLALVASRGRADHLEGILAAFREDMDRDLGRARARVRTAVALTTDERNALQTKLARALGSRHVVLEETVDANLLGGFVAESGSVIIDGSLEGQLARIRGRLAQS